MYEVTGEDLRDQHQDVVEIDQGFDINSEIDERDGHYTPDRSDDEDA